MATLQVPKRLDQQMRSTSVSPRRGGNETREDDGVEISTFCVIGDKLRQDSELNKAIRSFGHPIKYSNDANDDDFDEEVGFVLDEFAGPVFHKLQKSEATIFGPTYLRQLAARGLRPEASRKPVYCLSMEGLALCFNDKASRFKENIRRHFTLIQSMGGSIVKDQTAKRLTHILAYTCRGEKYQYATAFSIPVMSGDWIEAAWSRRHDIHFKADASGQMEKHKVKPFHGAHVHFLGFETVETEMMISELQRNGGQLCEEYTSPECTHVVVDDSKITTMPAGVPEFAQVVKSEWFWASIQIDACVEEKQHAFADHLGVTNVFSPAYEANKSTSGLFSPGTPGSASRKRKRRKALSQLGQNDPLVHSKSRRSSVTELNQLSMQMSGSFLDAPDQHLTPTPGRARTASTASRPSSQSNLLEVPPEISPALGSSENSRPPLSSASEATKTSMVELKAMTPRQRVFQELVQTETNFVNVLDTILEVFKKPLDDPNQIGGELLNNTEIKIIFGYLPPIFDVHKAMLTEFNDAIARWNENYSIGSVYLRYADELLKAYPPYVNFFEDSKNMLVKCEKTNPRFFAFLKVCQSRPESGRQHLADLLMHPIQRLPRVILLLTDILKQTRKERPDHRDIPQLETALNKIKEVLNHINEDKRKTEGQVQIFDIFNDIENCPADLISSHRLFLSKVEIVEVGGSDDKVCGKGYELALFLFSDVMEIAKKKTSTVKSLGLRSPSTMSLRTVGTGTLTNTPGHHPSMNQADKTSSRLFKHVNLMNLTAIKRVVDIMDCQNEGIYGVFALVCRTNQEVKERMFVFQLASDEVEKSKFLRTLCRTIANSMCRPDPDTYLKQMKAEELGLEPADFNVNVNFSSRAYRTLHKKVNRAFSFKTPTSRRIKRAVSSMISPIVPMPQPSEGRLSSTPSRDLHTLRMASTASTPSRDLQKLRMAIEDDSP